MAKHEVTCLKCGRRFDANEGGSYLPESHRYICKKCVDKQKSKQAEAEKARKAAEREEQAEAEQANEREARTGMRQSVPAMIAKIAAGAVVLIGSFPLLAQESTIEFIVGVAIAAGLAVWGLAPYLKAKKRG